MIVKSFIKKITGKTVDIHPDVPLSYILQRGINYSFGLFRGVVRGIGFGQNDKRLFIGQGVSILAKRKLFVGKNVRIGKKVSIDALSKEGIHFADNVKIGDYSQIIGTGSIKNMGIGLKTGRTHLFQNIVYLVLLEVSQLVIMLSQVRMFVFMLKIIIIVI
ncbi:Uncharacterised protein [Streptococcus pneumoniae]|nr:Uncharacterised protein [Streptococcus pneumoniae]